jgi:hypothetical protein
MMAIKDMEQLRDMTRAAKLVGVDALDLLQRPGVEDLVFYFDEDGGVRARSLLDDETEVLPLEQWLRENPRAAAPAQKPDDAGDAAKGGDNQQEKTMNLVDAVRFVRCAEAAGLNPLVLAQMPGADKLKLVERDGQVYATPEGGSEKLLEEYAVETWPDFVPALTAAGDRPRRDDGGTQPAALERVRQEFRADPAYGNGL